MRHRLIITLLCVLALGQVHALDDARQTLHELMVKADSCYLMDDYVQLYSLAQDYQSVLNSHRDHLGDSLDVYEAYHDKIWGAFYYGFAQEYNLSAIYSERCYLNSLRAFEDRHAEEHAMVLHQELAQLYYKMGDYAHAAQQLDAVCEFYDNHVNALNISSDQQLLDNALSQMAMCHARMAVEAEDDDEAARLLDQALQQIGQSVQSLKDQKSPYYADALRKQGKILMMQHDRLGIDNLSTAKRAYEQYVKLQCHDIDRRLSTMTQSGRDQYWLAIHQFLYDCYRLGDQASEMLYDLALMSKGYLLAREHNPRELETKWKQVRATLGRQDCAIEFVQYFGKHDERRMGCLVLRHNSPKPTFVDLVSIDSLLNTEVDYFFSLEDALTSTYQSDKDLLYCDSLASNKIWSPRLMSLIDGVKRVYFAPDGVLHQWAIEYMLPDSTMTGYRLSSTRNLLQRPVTTRLGKALLCGGIDFHTTLNPDEPGNDVDTYRFLSQRDLSINPLPGSEREVDSIYALRNHPGDYLLKGILATDEAFMRQLKNKYDIVHLSTHGFYSGELGINHDLKPLLNDYSMSHSGVMFAGAYNTLTDADFNENLPDGVLSAAELSHLDFSPTGLIVLSACQTGLGHITDDGVYGVERGLKRAGAHALCLSLWEVNDYATSLLMRFFYKNLQEQPAMDIHAALQGARKQLAEHREWHYVLDEYDMTYKWKEYTFDFPRFTHPFILIDAF